MGCKCSGQFEIKNGAETVTNDVQMKSKISFEETSNVPVKTEAKVLNTFETEDSYRYDLNISCHTDQLDWVESHLLSLFEDKLKLRCFLFQRDRPAGVSYTNTIEACLKHSRTTIVCFSNEYLLSSWKQFEALMIHHTDPHGMKRVMVPIVLDDCELPGKYKGLTALRWPSSERLSQHKLNIRLKFFWTNLLRSLDIQCPTTTEWWLELS